MRMSVISDCNADSRNYSINILNTVGTLEFMQAQMEPKEFIGFLKGNIIKYVARCGKKDDIKKDVTKIIRYAEWLKESYEGKTGDPRK